MSQQPSPYLLTQDLLTSQSLSEILSKIPSETSHLQISLPVESSSIQALEQALQSSRFKTITIDSPLTFSYFEVQKLLSLSKNYPDTQVSINYQARLDPHIIDLKTKALSSGANIASISINILSQKPTSPQALPIDPQYIDLLLNLSGQEVKVIQGFSDKPLADLQNAKFVDLSGVLTNDIPFSINTRFFDKSLSSATVQIFLDNSQTLSTIILASSIQKATTIELANLEDAAKVVRACECAFQSFKTNTPITLKRIGNGVFPARTVGTAVFLNTGVFVPAYKNPKIGLTGIHSLKQDKIKQLFTDLTRNGEPIEYMPSYEELVSNPYPKDYKPVFYTPSIPGERKDKEMLDALQAGYVVMAEKPPFANTELARKFNETVSDDLKKYLFFGWHSQHHYLTKIIRATIEKKTFGAIKHLRSFFTNPRTLEDERYFEHKQGGVGINIFSYGLHSALVLAGISQEVEVTKSNIESAQSLDPSRPDLAELDYAVDAQLTFKNGIVADLIATFDSTAVNHTELEITFEDGTRILHKEYIHPQNMLRESVLIKKAGSPRWEPYLTSKEKEHPDFGKTSYHQQIEFARRVGTGEEVYDMKEDRLGLGVVSNIKLHEVMDMIFEKGGFHKKKGVGLKNY